ncbi:membrane-bound O-acyltransferase domain-containing protein [Plectosphaerella cucumerina]|uniref:Membrane-bound O-acyltransferase domain-containing protein n=1 Tax=Plectosphaerella cucumerina TaxID=40658 RepID=A0A8K0T5S6_9PEZI|nr:membrane-bound O-acyltransferase domain-containing protein [Plectosphaerella cucumerina]
MLPYINAPFDFLSPKLGTPSDDLKLVFSWLISYPLAGLLKTIPDSRPDLKNGYVILISLVYLVGLFDLWSGVQTLVISAAGSYAIAKFLRHSPLMPWIGFVFLMGHLSVNQIARQIAGNPPSVDITGAQMVLVMKLSAFCWNVADGLLPEKVLTDHQKSTRLRELPSLLDFAGFVFFFPSLMGGPTFEFAEYQRFLDTTMFNLPPNLDASKKPPVRKKRKVPRSGTPAAWKAASGLMWIGLFVPMTGWYHPSVLTGPGLLDYGLLRRIWIFYCVGLTARMKYYGAWSLAEGACILTGLGYNGVDPITGKVSWNRLQNIDPRGVELAQNVRGFLGSWNMNTNKWLRNYVYLRVTPHGKKPGFRASMITFTTSALWHGFYPGYYMTFVLASLLQTVAKNFRRQVRPFFLHPVSGLPTPKKRIYDILSFLTTQITMSFAVAPFLVLSFSGSVLAWSRVYFFVVIGVLVTMGFFHSPAKQYLREKLEARQKRPGVQMARSLSQDSLVGREPVLGVAQDPERELDEAVREMKADFVELRRRQQSVLAAKAQAQKAQ